MKLPSTILFWNNVLYSFGLKFSQQVLAFAIKRKPLSNNFITLQTKIRVLYFCCTFYSDKAGRCCTQIELYKKDLISRFTARSKISPVLGVKKKLVKQKIYFCSKNLYFRLLKLLQAKFKVSLNLKSGLSDLKLNPLNLSLNSNQEDFLY